MRASPSSLFAAPLLALRAAAATICSLLAVASAPAAQVEPPVKAGKDGALAYAVDARGDRVPDFSHAGYRGGGVALPVAGPRVVVAPADGDDGARIQLALDYVAGLPLGADGLRGAVVLAAGRYEISGQLRIDASGVVLRGGGFGEDEYDTVLVATGTDRRALISIRGKTDRASTGGAALAVTNEYVPVGAMRLRVAPGADLKVGQTILIERPSSKEWIALLGMDTAPARTPFAWKPGKQNIVWERTIASISWAEGAAAGAEIIVDAPLTTALDKKMGGATVSVANWPGRIERVGVENLRCESAFDAANPRDEQHAWDAIHLDAVRDAWVRDVVVAHFAGSAVYLDAGASRVTVQDCASISPVSELAGYRRHTFHSAGGQTLFLRCLAVDGRNDFTVGYLSAGPNAFLESRAVRSSGFSGGIGSWSSGTLFDNVHIDGGELRLDNLETFNQGVGWAAANSVIWQASAGRFVVRTPPGARNWAVGVWGLFVGDGAWSSTSEFAEPGSLYRAQLGARLGATALKALGRADYAAASPSAHSPSAPAPTPTLEQAIPDLAARLARKSAAVSEPLAPALAVANGRLVVGAALLIGRASEVTWWRGRLDPARAAEVGPSLTRFSPGRSGPGLTDDLDQLTDALRAVDRDGLSTVALRHHYGLWYDRRRDDHQMNKRPDAEAYPPFFEQPFLRSGQGEAWDRLSRYDLTRYNPWYFGRLKTFAALARAKGLVLIDEMYFQHNIIESGAHWVDSPWRPVNTINATGFVEPPPFTGDTIKMADEFYDVKHPVRAPLHRAYIRQCLANLADEPNVIHTLSEEYTGPLHFMRFWLDVAEEWMRETGKRPLLALSATKDVQDAILADPRRAALVSVIDLKYWFRTARGEEFAPRGGESLAPRQHLRKWKGGRPSAASIAGMVREYRAKFPDKAVIAELGEADGWAFVFAGGSLAKLPATTDPRLLASLARAASEPSSVRTPGDAVVFADGAEILVYLPTGGSVALMPARAGTPARDSLALHRIDLATGLSAATSEATAPSGKPAAFWWKRP